MGHLWRNYRAAKEKLPKVEEWEVIDLGDKPGDFVIGRAAGMFGKLVYRPNEGEPPHGLIAGSTGIGKTVFLNSLGLRPMLWNRYFGSDWKPTLILDSKGGAGFHACAANGAEVVTKPAKIRERLENVYNEVERRNRIMGEVMLHRPDASGVMREVKAETIADFNQAERDEHRMHPWLIVIDELRDLLGEMEGLTREQAKDMRAARSWFTQIVQKARSAGIITFSGIQQPRADILGGFARDQIGARLVGRSGSETLTMVLGDEANDIKDEGKMLAVGQAYAVGMGGRSRTLVRLPKINLDTYRELAQDPDRAPVSESLSDLDSAIHLGKHRRDGGESRGFGKGGQAWVLGPVCRGWLRMRALRHLTGPVVTGTHYRSEAVRVAAWERGDGRCECCGRGGQLEVDHTVPLSFGGKDDIDNVRLLCARGGSPSCHDSKTKTENWVRSVRRRMGTYDDGLPAGAPLYEKAWLLAKTAPLYWYLFGGCYALGLLHGGWWWWVSILWLLLGPVWAVVIGKAAKRDLAPHPDRGVDPRQHRQVFIEMMKAKANPRRWRNAFTIGHHERTANRDFGRVKVKRMSEFYLLGWSGLFLLTQGLPILFGLLLILL